MTALSFTLIKLINRKALYLELNETYNVHATQANIKWSKVGL